MIRPTMERVSPTVERVSPTAAELVRGRLESMRQARKVKITRTRPAVGPDPAPGDIVFFAPPLVVTEADIEWLVSVARDAVEVVLGALC
jgi:adenosylmethionine-8-amino-7-oxononanoate aminotransferase